MPRELAQQGFGFTAQPTVGQHASPELVTGFFIGHGEMKDRLETARKGFVEVVFQIGSQQHGTGKFFDTLQQVGGLLVAVPVVGRACLGAGAEQGIGFVEKEYPVVLPGPVEQAGQVFLRLSDVFGYHCGEVYPVDGPLGTLAQQSGGQGFSGTGRTVEQAAKAGTQPPAQSLLLPDLLLVGQPMADLFEIFPQVIREDQIVPV